MIEIERASKTFRTDEGDIHAVRPTTLSISEGDIFGIIGFSGAGKSTLLRLVNLLERPDSGRISVAGQDLTNLAGDELRHARQAIGMIFQHFNLLSNRTVCANVEFPLEVAGVEKEPRRSRALECLDIVGLSEKANTYPGRLSGGQKQRVAIARALANEPKVLLCDEPTSSLDAFTALSILRFLKDIRSRLGVTILFVTHEIKVIEFLCNRVAIMADGAVVEELDLTSRPIHPQTDIGKFLFETSGGWDEDQEIGRFDRQGRAIPEGEDVL